MTVSSKGDLRTGYDFAYAQSVLPCFPSLDRLMIGLETTQSRNNQLVCILAGALYEKRAGPYIKCASHSNPAHVVFGVKQTN